MAGKSAGRKRALVSFSLLFLGFMPTEVRFSSQSPKAPLWWDLKVELKTEGQYRTGEGETVFSGDYGLSVIWTGTLERDAEDYRLFHGRSETTGWNAQETADSPTSLKVLTGEGIREVPDFKMEYVLKKDDRLHFAFLVEGFYAPRSAAAQKRFIPLPTTQECPGSLPEPNYDSFVVKGTNSVSFEEKEIYKKPVKKDFVWTWKRQQWQIQEKGPSLFSAQHRARVCVSITPHFEQ